MSAQSLAGPRHIQINWRREAILPALALAHVSLATPWFLALLSNGDQIDPVRAAGACLALVLFMLYLIRIMEGLRVNGDLQRLIALIAIVGACLLALRVVVFYGPQWKGWTWLLVPFRDSINLFKWLPDDLIVLFGVIWFSRKGLRLATEPLTSLDVMRGFKIGIVMLSILVMLDSLMAGHDLTIFVPPYFFSQLLATGLTRVETIEQERGGKRSPFTGWWLTVLLSAAGLVVVVAGGISAAVLGIGPDQLLRWLGPFLAIITLPVALVLLPILTVLAFLAELLVRTISFRFPNIMAPTSPAPGNTDPGQLPAAIQTAIRVIGYGKGAVTLLVFIAALVAVALIIGRLRASREGEEGEQHESIWSRHNLLAKLRAQLQNRLSRLSNLANIAGRFGAGGLYRALTVRRVYAQTVRLAASKGYPRPAARTPYEHLATLQRAIPGCDAEMSQITEAYVAVHYGEVPEHPEALTQIRAAFDRVKARAEEAKREPRA